MIDRDTYFMRMALMQAEQAAAEGEIPVGAVIVCGDRVLAKCHNQTETLNDVTAHAEMLAITAAADALGGKYLPQCTLYVTVEPCPMCAGALGWSQIGRIVYGAPDVKRGYMSVFGMDNPLARSPLHPRTVVESGLLADEAAELMRSFFRARR
ncbi:MAG: nucleoside deaminase [Muribaculaceae bacterium]|nr:nucleoside deaminase [Bacteroides sp.]MDE7497126.1 nucleoside deaminase [Muribaculaceae bacterium]